jgi:hypothetical protein
MREKVFIVVVKGKLSSVIARRLFAHRAKMATPGVRSAAHLTKGTGYESVQQSEDCNVMGTSLKTCASAGRCASTT